MNANLLASACALAASALSNGTSDPGTDATAARPDLPDGQASAPALEEEATPLPREYKTLFQNDDIEFHWGGRLFYDWGWFDSDSGYPAGDDDGSEFRAARIFTEGTIHKIIRFKAEYDFAGNDADFKDVYLATDVAVGEVKGEFQAGHFKEPFGLEQLTSSRFITFMERSLQDVFTPARNNGFMFSSCNDEQNLNWAAGIFRATNDGASSSGDGEYALTGRVAGTVWNEDDGARVLHVGGALSFRDDDDGMVVFSDEPEAHLLSDIPYAVLDADGVNLLNGEVAWVDGPLSVQSEIALASVDVNGGSDGDYSGVYVQGSYFLTGEHRNYKAKGARFDRVKPMENYDGHGFDGAWEVGARISMNNFDDGPTDNQTTNFTAGVNWYLNPFTRIMLNLIHSNFDDDAANLDEDADFLMMRFQVDW